MPCAPIVLSQHLVEYVFLFLHKQPILLPFLGELNEYGLLASYSALGITNRCYVQRVDIDLTELTASLVRPTGSPANGDYWLDTSTSVWGIQEYNQTTNTFTVETPIIIDDTADVIDPESDPTPLATVGSIGDYAIVTCATDTKLLGYYKNSDNDWVQGSFGSCDYCDAFQSEFSWDSDFACQDVQQQLAQFGRGYLDDMLTTEQVLRQYDADANWDSDSEAAAFWVRRAVMDYGVE